MPLGCSAVSNARAIDMIYRAMTIHPVTVYLHALRDGTRLEDSRWRRYSFKVKLPLYRGLKVKGLHFDLLNANLFISQRHMWRTVKDNKIDETITGKTQY